MKTRFLTRAALFAALTAVLAQVVIPLPGLVPISLATFAVLLSGALLGPKWGLVSQLVYLCIGLAGAPVFAGMHGGPGVLAGPTGGYLIGYAAAALVTGLLLTLRPTRPMLPLAMLAGALACYAFGTAWYMVATGNGLAGALAACVLPFLPGDAIKILVGSLVAARIGVLRLSRADSSAS